MKYILFVIRWIVALPAGVLGTIFVSFPMHWAIMLAYFFSSLNTGAMATTVSDDGTVQGCLLGLICFISAESLERIGQAFISTFVTITIAARIVPSHRFWFVAVCTSLYIISMLSFATWIVAGGGNRIVDGWIYGGYSGWLWLEGLAVVLMGSLGATIPLYLEFATRRRTTSKLSSV